MMNKRHSDCVTQNASIILTELLDPSWKVEQENAANAYALAMTTAINQAEQDGFNAGTAFAVNSIAEWLRSQSWLTRFFILTALADVLVEIKKTELPLRSERS